MGRGTGGSSPRRVRADQQLEHKQLAMQTIALRLEILFASELRRPT